MLKNYYNNNIIFSVILHGNALFIQVHQRMGKILLGGGGGAECNLPKCNLLNLLDTKRRFFRDVTLIRHIVRARVYNYFIKINMS